MTAHTLSELADIGAKAACARLPHGDETLIVHKAHCSYSEEAKAREAFVKAVLDAVGYKLPVDPEREAFDAWVTSVGWDLRDSPFEAWKAGRDELRKQPDSSTVRRDALYKEMRERFKAEEQRAMQALENSRATKPQPETFEAHGHTWFKHTPGDPMPVARNIRVEVLCSSELDGQYDNMSDLAGQWNWSASSVDHIVGWRYADS